MLSLEKELNNYKESQSYYYNIAFYWDAIDDSRIEEFKEYLRSLYPFLLREKECKILCFKNLDNNFVEFYLKLNDMDILYHFSIDRKSLIKLIR